MQQYITSTARLKETILLLESERNIQGHRLKDEFHQAYSSIKPVNLLKNTLNEVVSSPLLMDKVLATAIGLATGFITKKFIVGGSDNKYRKIIGTIFEFGVINIVAQRNVFLKTVGRLLLNSFIQKKETISENSESN